MEKVKVLAVFGNSASGKTITSIKIAREIATHKKNVIVVALDSSCPVIPYILPSTAVNDFSLGELLAKPTVSQTEILSACVPVEDNEYITVLGYKIGESLSLYPKVIASKVIDLIINLKHIADYVIIDCTTTIEHDVSTVVALQLADKVLKLGTSDLKGISYFYTADRLLADSKFDKEKQIAIISNLKTGQEWETVSAEYGGAKFVLPHCTEIEEQMQEVGLFEPLIKTDSTLYNTEIAKVVESVFSLATPTVQKKGKVKKVESTDNGDGTKKEKKGFKLPFGKSKPKGEF